MSAQTILITGAAGFIGSHAAEKFTAAGYRVVGVDNYCNYYDRAWKEANVKVARLQVEEADITDGAKMDALVSRIKPYAILHLAAMAGVRPSIERPSYYARINVEGTTCLLEAAARYKVAKFLFASSSSVYGNRERVPFSEADPVAEPISPYAATKRAGELMCHTFWKLYGLPVFCLRFFTVYGPRQRPDLAIQKFTRLLLAEKPIPVYGDGSTSRDYTYVEDTVAGIASALEKCRGFGIYNLGGSDPVTLSTLISELERATGKKAIIDRRPAQPGDVERTYADLTRSTADLGYAPKVRLAEGLARFVAWYRTYGHLYP